MINLAEFASKKKLVKTLSTIFTYTALLIGVLLVLVPNLWMVSTSFKTEPETITIPPRWIPKLSTLESYWRLWNEYPFITYFRNSILVAIGSVLLAVVFSSLAKYGVT